MIIVADTAPLSKEDGLIASVKDVMDELIANGMWSAERLYVDVLAIAQEL